MSLDCQSWKVSKQVLVSGKFSWFLQKIRIRRGEFEFFARISWTFQKQGLVCWLSNFDNQVTSYIVLTWCNYFGFLTYPRRGSQILNILVFFLSFADLSPKKLNSRASRARKKFSRGSTPTVWVLKTFSKIRAFKRTLSRVHTTDTDETAQSILNYMCLDVIFNRKIPIVC